MTFNFLEYKKLLCKAYQTPIFNLAFEKGKKDYLENFGYYLPYPIKDYPEELQMFQNFLQEKIDNLNILELVLISKSQAKMKYKLNDVFFERWYHEPEQRVEMVESKERFGKKMFSYLYNENKIIQILDSNEYLEQQEHRKLKKLTNQINKI